jgi:hypothetical protein
MQRENKHHNQKHLLHHAQGGKEAKNKRASEEASEKEGARGWEND